MIKEDYVSFETAKLLKEKGFDVPSYKPEEWLFCMYDEEGKLQWGCYSDDWYCRVTLQMAMKWLREEYKLQVSPRYDEVEDEKERLHYVWFFDILSMNPYKMLSESEQGYNTYEEACEAAIKYCLENLI